MSSNKKGPVQPKERKFFLNNMNSWLSNFIIEEMRTDYLPDAKIKNEFMGTLNNSGSPLPRLFEPKETKIEIGYNYNQEVFFNDYFIYNLQDSNLSEAEFLIKGLRSLKYETEKVLVLITSIMTWAKTPPKIRTETEIDAHGFNEEEFIEKEVPRKKKKKAVIVPVEEEEEKVEEPLDPEQEEAQLEAKAQAKAQAEALAQAQAQAQALAQSQMQQGPKHRTFYYKDSDYLCRVPSKKYLQYKMIETLALANTNPLLKVYIICPGFIYGCGEDFFFDYFRMAWLQSPEVIPLIGKGTNYIPTIHIKDLVTVIKKVIDKKPITRYIVACDKTKNPQLENIIGAISDCVGNGYLDILTEFNVDDVDIPNFNELSMDLKIRHSKLLHEERKPDEDKEDFEKRRFIWHCEYGIAGNLDMIRNEFNLYRGLKNVKIMITGPPSSGKSSLAEALNKEFNLPILKLGDMIEEAKNGDNAMSEEIKQKYIEIEEIVAKALEDYDKRKNKRKTDPPLDTAPLRKLPNSLISKIVRCKLSQNLCQNQGYILDGYPKKYQDAFDLFMDEKPSPKPTTEPIEGEEPPKKEYVFNSTIAPQSVIRLTQCPDEILKERVKQMEEYPNNMVFFDERFTRRNNDYKTNNELDPNRKLIDFYNENLIDTFDFDGKIKKEDYLSEVKLNEFLQRNGSCNNKARLVDDEDIIIISEQDDLETPNEINKMDNVNEIKSEENNEIQKEEIKMKILNDKLLELKEREKKLLEKKSEVLRRYLSENVIPLLSKGILNVCQTLPDDPVEALSNYLLDNAFSKQNKSRSHEIIES